MAASNERIVSSGRSQRERVGLERSGSAGVVLAVFFKMFFNVLVIS